MTDEPRDVPHIEVRSNGPYRIRGSVVVRRPDGTILKQDQVVALCRCGASLEKPFCDGTHKRIAFTAD